MEEKILIQADYILTWKDGWKIIRDGELLIEGNTIVYCGKQEERQGRDFSRVIHGKNKMIMPGFVNAHTHAAMSLFRGYADDLPLMEWLEKKIWPAEANLKGEDIYWGTLLAICEMIKGGTTCFADMYFIMEEVARACYESGIRASLSRGLIGLSKIKDIIGLKESKTLVKNWHGQGEGRITVMLGPHAPYTCPPRYLHKVMELAAELNVPLHMHLAETVNEVDQSIKEYGKRPVEHMGEIGLLEHRLLAAHCVHLTPEEIEILAERKVAVAHNPGSNLKLGSGVAPVTEMLEKGVLVSLGTDGAASNNNLDMVEEMRLAALLQKGLKQNPTVLPVEETLKMATLNGAKALYLEVETGTLAPGSRADLIMFDLSGPHLNPLHNPLAQIAYSAMASDIDLVAVDGKVLLEKGELKTIDEERVLFEASRRAFRLVEAD